MAAKKLTRKQLLKEPDEFLTTSGRFFMFIVERKWHFLGLVGIIVLVAAIASGIHFVSQRSQSNAFASLAEIQATYQNELSKGDPGTAYANTQASFEALLDKYTGRQAGKIGRLVYANAAFSGGDFAKAIELFEIGLGDWSEESTNYNLALYGLGHAHKSAGNLDAALDFFSKLANGSLSVLKPEAYFYLAQIYEQKADATAQQEALRKIVSDYPDFIFVDMVKAQLAEAS